MIALLCALLLTLLLEGLTVFVLTRDKDWLAISAAGNLITNPVLNVLRGLLGLSLWGTLALELAAAAAEALLYRLVLRAGFQRACGISLAANTLSFLLGSALLFLLWR